MGDEPFIKTSTIGAGRRYDGGQYPIQPMSLVENQPLASALLYGKDNDELITPRGAFTTKRVFEEAVRIFGYSPVEFAQQPPAVQNDVIRRIERGMLKTMKKKGIKPKTHARFKEVQAEELRRTELHKSLALGWARGPLKLERPSGSSLHHLIRYDNENNEGFQASVIHNSDVQLFVVENDWGRLVPLSKGEWRLPFKHICWEFRISGVRVITMTIFEGGEAKLFTVYGRDKMWVADDYLYTLTQDGLKGKPHSQYTKREAVEFYAVAQMVYANIRASCIMLDANVATKDEVKPGPELVRQAQRQGVAPPRTHHVVRLFRRNVYRHHGAGGNVGGGYRQGGHWRPGRWLHYDNQESGQEKYVNDGGFWLSKSWQPWHFAGDPNRIIEKEYRL